MSRTERDDSDPTRRARALQRKLRGLAVDDVVEVSPQDIELIDRALAALIDIYSRNADTRSAIARMSKQAAE